MDLGDVIVDLYLRAPSDFVAVRTDRARAAREDGDPDQARLIARLAKPSAAAWLVNLLSARKSREIDQVIALGRDMREAEKDLAADDLRRLGRQRLLLIRSIAALGNDLAADAGHRMSTAALAEVEQTLQAAMSDDAAADAVRSGRLIRALSSNGIDPVDVDGAVAAPSVAVPRLERPALRPVERAAAERRLAEAEERATATREKADAAEHARREIRARRTALAEHRLALVAERTELADRIASLDRDIATAERDDDALARAAASADHDAEVADRAAQRASERLKSLRRDSRN
ncbi:MAG: hypothetical protein ABWX76_05180 [Leifsonia flava]